MKPIDKMTIYYSPFFNGETFRNLQTGVPVFEHVFGNEGLLSFLELRLGLPGVEGDAVERTVAYRDALQAACCQGAFYEDAFQNDPLATAKEILHWRDVLVLEGFTPDTRYASPRLRMLARVEEEFCRKGLTGTPERWKAVAGHLTGPVPETDFIVRQDRALLPRLIREVLDKAGAQWKQDVPVREKKTSSVILHHFNEVADAFRWARDNNTSEAVICPDPFRMNAVLRNRGKERLDASSEGEYSLTQLVRLGLSLLKRPWDVNDLLDYLTLPWSPLPDRLRNGLARALRKDGGLGDTWNGALEEFCSSDETKEEAWKADTFLLSLLDAEVRDGTVSAAVVTDWCTAVAARTEDYRGDKVFPIRKAGMAELAALCRSVMTVVGDSPRIRVDNLLRDLKTLYGPHPAKTERAMAGSWNAVDSHRCFVDAPESLLWLPCNGSLQTPYPYGFLLKEEAKELELPAVAAFIRSDFDRMKVLLDRVDTVELCICDFDRCEPLPEHPAVTLLKKSASEDDQRSTCFTPSVFHSIHTLETGRDLNPLEDGEDVAFSASSIGQLVSYPFDYVMQRTLGFRKLSDTRMPSMTLTQGSVAHYVFELMLDRCEKGLSKMRAMLEKKPFHALVTEAALKKGAILFLKENRTAFSHFEETVRNSIGVLLDILEKSGLTPGESEEPLDQELDFARIRGSVDFYATTPSGKIVIIDFKYSKGKAYIDSLEEDTSIQLELYAETLAKKLGAPVVAKAYYFFPINQLHTYEEYFGTYFRGDHIVTHRKPDNLPPLEDRIKESVKTRKEQLSQGVLEMEEGSPLEQIEYHVKAMDGSLLDIPSVKDRGKEVKAPSHFDKPASYPILKDYIQ